MSGGELFRELYLDASPSSLPAGVGLGPVVFAPALMPIDPATQRVVAGGMEEQLRALLQNMDRLLEAAGGTRQDVARVTLFMADVTDRTAMNRVWKEWYPDENDRPPHKYVPVPLPDGILAGAQVIALVGSDRQVIEIPGLHHQDWMSLAGRQGNLVVSSRIVGSDPSTGRGSQDPVEHTALAFANAEAILERAGGSWDNIAQVTAFIGGEELRTIVEEAWRLRVQGDRDECPLHILETNLGGQGRGGLMLPRLEIMALL